MPVMVCMDGFILTHAYERVDMPSQADVDAFLPPYEPRQVLDPDEPVSIGAMVGPEAFMEVRYLAHAKQISALEQHFGTRLLLRTTRQLALTEDGRIFYERARSVLGEMKEIEEALARNRREPAGRLRVSAPALMGRLLIAPLLGDFLRACPSLSVDLLLIDRNVDLIEEDVHLALRVGRVADSQLVTRKLGEVQMIHCASPDYLKRRGMPQTPRRPRRWRSGRSRRPATRRRSTRRRPPRRPTGPSRV